MRTEGHILHVDLDHVHFPLVVDTPRHVIEGTVNDLLAVDILLVEGTDLVALDRLVVVLHRGIGIGITDRRWIEAGIVDDTLGLAVGLLGIHIIEDIGILNAIENVVDMKWIEVETMVLLRITIWMNLVWVILEVEEAVETTLLHFEMSDPHIPTTVHLIAPILISALPHLSQIVPGVGMAIKFQESRS